MAQWPTADRGRRTPWRSDGPEYVSCAHAPRFCERGDAASTAVEATARASVKEAALGQRCAHERRRHAASSMEWPMELRGVERFKDRVHAHEIAGVLVQIEGATPQLAAPENLLGRSAL